MAYATYTDVQLRLAAWLSAFTVPSTSQMTTLCEEASAMLDMTLKGAGFTVPATGTSDLIALRGYVADYVAYKSWQIAFGDDEIPANLEVMLNNWQSFLAGIKDGSLSLLDQSTEVGRLGVVYSRVNGADDVTSYILNPFRDEDYPTYG
jgi:hypothetical protein